MHINKYPSDCMECGISLAPGEGLAFKDDDVWRPVCKGLECVKRACPQHLSDYRQIMALEKASQKEADQSAIERAKKNKLYPYQIEGVEWLTKQDNCLLADDMGLGKTNQVLTSLDSKYGTLVVAPSHLKLNWREEAKKWRPDLEVIVLKNGKEFIYPQPGQIVITTYGLLPWWLELPDKKRKNLMVEPEEYEAMQNIVLVFDEVQALKNNKASKSKRAKFLMKMAHKTIGITGTPILNRELELWNICGALGIEKKIFESFPRFLYYFKGRKGQYGYTFMGPRKETPSILRRAMLRREKKDVDIQLPNKVYIEIPIELSKKEKKILDNAWDLYKSSETFEKEELPDFKEFSRAKLELAESKIKTLESVVEDLQSKDIVPIVFSAQQKPVDAFKKKKGWKIIKGEGTTSNQKHKISEDFQAGKLKGLAATIKSAGTGLTLTRSQHVIFNDLDFVPANNVQAEDRVARIGQKANKVFIYHLVADHPLDRHIRRLILKKMALAEAALVEDKIKIDAPSDTETEKDYKERVKKVKKKETDLVREAIVSRLKCWPTTKKKISDDLVKSIMNFQSEINEDDARIVRLLKKAGLKTVKEKQCLYAVYQRNESFLTEDEKNILTRT